ncbi:hypothetical protein FSP39_019415 [Pinctada imbricata]|uniref:C-type lectin domain-containing protein n=1 Tax=Pinctada imbricata TaxID=66713 RepID=A0AA88YFS8_PINIB|nr:hypothetical protein FSP39_019415 [Pinctada imbricata]
MQDFIRAKLVEQHYDKTWRFWIGASDREHEGKWQWLSEPRKMEYSNWSPGQGTDQHGFLFIPGGGTEDCAVLDVKDHAQWHDYPCSSGAGFWYSHICQFSEFVLA